LSKAIESHFPELSPIFVSSAPDCIPAGTDWLSQTEHALQSTKIMIVLACQKSLATHWVNFEIGSAWSNGIPIIFVCYRDVDPESLPTPYTSRQAIALTDVAPERGIRSIFFAIENLLDTKQRIELSESKPIEEVISVLAEII